MIFKILKVVVSVIGLSLLLWLITLTQAGRGRGGGVGVKSQHFKFTMITTTKMLITSHCYSIGEY